MQMPVPKTSIKLLAFLAQFT